MEVMKIEHETMSEEYAQRINDIFGWKMTGPPCKEGDLIYRDLDMDDVVYKRVGRYREENRQSEASVRSFFDKHKKAFKREYHWILTKDQVGDYCFYRSVKQLNTLQREYPEKFIVVDKQ